MTKSYLFILLLFSFVLSQSAFARPTISASNVKTTIKGCNSLTISWTNGNGSDRLVIARYDSTPVFTPTDGVMYIANNAFGGSGSMVSQNEFVVYNGIGNTVTVNNLTQGRTIYFKIYEFDFNPTTQYLNNNSPSFYDSLYTLNINHTLTIYDSCQVSNLFKLENLSSTNVPNIQFRVSTSTFDSLYNQPIYMHFSSGGYQEYHIKTVSGFPGCSDDKKYTVKIFPRKLANIDFANISDTVQEFTANLFKFRTSPVMLPFPVGVTYQWDYGDGFISPFTNPSHSYEQSGRFKIKFITEAKSYNKPTNCRDTQSFTVLVGRDPSLNINVYPTYLWEDSTYTHVSFVDSLIQNMVWRFGDGDSSFNGIDSHKYKYGGLYTLTLDFTTVGGKKGTYQTYIVVDSMAIDTNDNSIKQPIAGNMLIYPNPSNGTIHLDKLNMDGAVTIGIIDCKGGLVSNKYYESIPDIIDLSDLSQGYYTIAIESESRLYYFRLFLE